MTIDDAVGGIAKEKQMEEYIQVIRKYLQDMREEAAKHREIAVSADDERMKQYLLNLAVQYDRIADALMEDLKKGATNANIL